MWRAIASSRKVVLAGFSVLFVVETNSPQHGIGRRGSQCQQRNPFFEEMAA
jgi:hypothetical protein